MKDNKVMINPARPMIMYESMSIHLDSLEFQEVSLELSSTTLEIDGKRGNACLSCDLVSQGKTVGHGKKFMLLSGLRDYCQETIDNIVSQYQQALQLLPVIAQVQDCQQQPLPTYDGEFVLRELNIFKDWLLGVHCQICLDCDTQVMFDQVFTTLINNAAQQPKVGMHRDFHSRNLMVKQQQLWVIDYQDAVIGPITYDAVSLLRDCYIRWPATQVEQLKQYHYQLCIEHGLLAAEVPYSQYSRWFDLMGIQRHLKAAGIFARLNHRDGKTAYLRDIPLTLSYIVDIASQYDELKALSKWVADVLLPRFES